MHDPETLAFVVKVGRWRLAEVWHVDPEIGGDEDSCGWTFPKLTEYEMELADSLIYDQYDNLKLWYQGVENREALRRIRQIFRIYKGAARPWWRHPRWHVWHWRISMPVVRRLKRWLFSRCAYCGGRFAWGFAPVSTRWNGTGPLWFRSEECVYHYACYAAFVLQREADMLAMEKMPGLQRLLVGEKRWKLEEGE